MYFLFVVCSGVDLKWVLRSPDNKKLVYASGQKYWEPVAVNEIYKRAQCQQKPI